MGDVDGGMKTGVVDDAEKDAVGCCGKMPGKLALRRRCDAGAVSVSGKLG